MAFPVSHLETRDVGRRVKVPIKGGGYIEDTIIQVVSTNLHPHMAHSQAKVHVCFQNIGSRTPFGDNERFTVDPDRMIEFVA